jgi:molecular chaperone GrpE
MRDSQPKLTPAEAKDSEVSIPVRVVKQQEEPVRVTDRRFWAQDQSTVGEMPAGSHSFKPAYVEELEKKLADSQQKVEEVLASCRELRAEAAGETQQARERIQNEYNRRLSQATAEVAKKFVDVLENFERALAAAKGDSSFNSLLEGVELIRNQFLATLTAMGVSELKVEGQPFDPQISEAVGTIDVAHQEQDQRIIEVVSKGYVLDRSLVRPAKVRVGRYLPGVQETSTR